MDTIRSSTEIDTLFRTGRRSRRPTVIVLCVNTPEHRSEAGRVVYIAGKKLGGAVQRNRSKRVLREAVRRTGERWHRQDIALIATTRTATARPEDLDEDLKRAITGACS